MDVISDTTSHILGLGKRKFFQIPENKWVHHLDNFHNGPDKESVVRSGELIMLLIKSLSETLDGTRVRAFHAKANTTGANLSKLPPTSAAFEQYSLWTYLISQGWCGHDLIPKELGWKLEYGKYKPVTSRKLFAPEAVSTKTIKCSCIKTCSGNHKCSCRITGITCGFACKLWEFTCQNCEWFSYFTAFSFHWFEKFDKMIN